MIRDKFLVEDPGNNVAASHINAVPAKLDGIDKDELDRGRRGIRSPESVFHRVIETRECP